MSGDTRIGGVKWAELQAPWPAYCHKHRTTDDGKQLHLCRLAHDPGAP